LKEGRGKSSRLKKEIWERKRTEDLVPEDQMARGII
jgi:hypothetical protein